MKQPNVIGGYIVELFRPNRLINHDAVDRLVAQFRAGLENLKGGVLWTGQDVSTTPTSSRWILKSLRKQQETGCKGAFFYVKEVKKSF
jgi:hypothetical protein